MFATLRTATDLGDLGVVLPLAAILLLWLIARGDRRGALCLLTALAICAVWIGSFKVYWFACPPAADLHSPSGHVSMSILVYGSLFAVIAQNVESRWQNATWIGCMVLALLIAISRVELHAHSMAETFVGAIIGLTTLSIFVLGRRGAQPTPGMLRPLIIAAVVTVVLLHGERVNAEELVHAIGGLLKSSAPVC